MAAPTTINSFLELGYRSGLLEQDTLAEQQDTLHEGCESPQQLALAILFDYLDDRERAIRLSESFMRDVVANLDNDWAISGEEIDAFLRRAG